MKGTQLRKELIALEQSQRGFARKLDIDERTVRNWIQGRSPVPPHITLMLEMVKNGHTLDQVIGIMLGKKKGK